MPIDLTNLKLSPIPQKKPVFEDNKKCSYTRAFGRSDKVVLDGYGEYDILKFMELFPDNKDINYYIKYEPYLMKYRILNHLAVATNVYKMKEPLIYAVDRKNCRYRFTKILSIKKPCFLEIMVQAIIFTHYYCDEMMTIIMDCSEEDAAKDYVPHIKWGIIVNAVDKTATLIDRESAAIQFHKRFRLIKHTFLK